MNELDQEIDWTDLPDKNLGRQLDSFESQLLCPICQDLFENPQMLKCGHSFCSLCLRKNCDQTLNRTTNDICPTCREKTELYDARKNVTLSSIILQYKEMKKTLFQKLSKENHSSLDGDSALSILSGRDYTGIKGKAIVSRVSQPHLHGFSRDKVRKYIDGLLKDSKIKLNMDGDKETLERRLRELIHQMNAQVDADNPLSLDAVVKKVNDSESARRRVTNAEHLVSTTSFKRSFSDLTKRALEQRMTMKERLSTQSDKVLEDSEEQNGESEKSLIESNRWRVVLSSATQRPFYYDTVTKTGQFDTPPEFQHVNCEVSNDSNPSGITEVEETRNTPEKPSRTTEESASKTRDTLVEEEVIVIESNENSRVEIPLTAQSQSFTQAMTQSPSTPMTGEIAAETWPCSACTFLNSPSDGTCAMCGTKNDRKRPRRSQRKSQMKLSL